MHGCEKCMVSFLFSKYKLNIMNFVGSASLLYLEVPSIQLSLHFVEAEAGFFASISVCC